MFDTLRYTKTLESAGVSREHAEAHVRIIAEIVEGELATKRDIERIENAIIQLEYRLIIKLGAIIVTTASLVTAVIVAITKLA